MTVNLPHWMYATAWVLWALWFAVWETLAILDPGRNETLSGHVRNLMWRDGKPGFWAFVLGPTLVWLAYHFYIELRRKDTG